MDRVAEEPFAGVLQQIGEEQRGRQLFELGFTRFPQAERLVLLLAAQFSEGFMIFVLTPRLGVGDPEVIDLFGHQRQLITHLFRHVGIEGPLHIPDGAGGVRGIELAVDKLRDAGLFGTGTEFIRRD